MLRILLMFTKLPFYCSDWEARRSEGTKNAAVVILRGFGLLNQSQGAYQIIRIVNFESTNLGGFYYHICSPQSSASIVYRVNAEHTVIDRWIKSTHSTNIYRVSFICEAYFSLLRI